MADLSVLSVEILAAHGDFTAASLPALRTVAEDVEIAVGQLDLEVKRIRARGGDATVAVDLVARWTARLEGVRRELLTDAAALSGRT
jgi:hypothetical protein